MIEENHPSHGLVVNPIDNPKMVLRVYKTMWRNQHGDIILNAVEYGDDLADYLQFQDNAYLDVVEGEKTLCIKAKFMVLVGTPLDKYTLDDVYPNGVSREDIFTLDPVWFDNPDDLPDFYHTFGLDTYHPGYLFSFNIEP